MEEKKSKEEIKRIRQLNRSLVGVPQGTAQSFGITSIQPEHAVFYKGNFQYVKIYMIKISTITADSAKILIRQISSLTKCRLRITSYVKEGDSKSTMRFLSLFVTASDYASAYEKYCDFENKVKSDIGICMIGAEIEACSLDHTLMFMQMNFTGQLKVFNVEHVFKKREDWGQLMIPAVDVNERFLTIHPNELICSCYYGKDFYEDTKNYGEMILKSGYNVFSCVDVQSLNNDERMLLNKFLEQKYTAHVENDESQLLYNLSYLLFISSVSEEIHTQQETQIMTLAQENGILLECCSGIQLQSYLSMCTLGIRDYKAMRNVSEDVASKLIL